MLVYGIEARGSIHIVERLTMSMSDGETHGKSVLELFQSQMVGIRIPVTDIRSILFCVGSLLIFSRESAP